MSFEKKNTVLEGHKMKSCSGITLLLLGLFIQGSSTANTTQSYYFELQVESSAFDNFTLLLGNITELTVDNAIVTSITITTDCQSNICTCAQNYSWSTDVCNIHPECCQNNNKSCSSVFPGAMCLYKNSVVVDGSFTIQNGNFPDNIDEGKKNFSESLTSIYSSMNWFDSLNITNLRSGSVIGDFIMLINGPFNLTKLVDKTNELQNKLNATFIIITTGFIKITAPDRIGYDTSANITCTTPENLDNVNWYIQKGASKQSITNGTEATVTRDGLSSKVILNKTSETWKGIFICDFTSKNSPNIIHRASVYMDIALLPQIFITSDPQFPNCNNVGNTVSVTVKCIIDNSTETYNVTWLPKPSTLQATTSIGNITIYNNNIKIKCEDKKDVYNATCIFTNRENNKRIASLDIPVIHADSIVCPTSGDWPEAKANFSAKLQCKTNEIGFQSRNCTGSKKTGDWGVVTSQCVNTEIWTLLTEAQNLQRGCGLVKDNANNLFDLLKVKSEDQIINTFPNINASVDILDTLHNASKIQNTTFNESMATNFVKSSSNLLNSSLLQNWNTPDKETDYSLAIKYLKAVEGVANQINTSINKTYKEDLKTYFV
ncbi:hypothetical protein AMELA_G00125670 [Ameiurus melas]|uniref:Ig-like domain-containing protein n=1 Tax=Ameiurus melas TaxID=219545 RepID=A0A7J6ANT2_AMEME|nr:hypothetical protein AMELA_G00125670 [Ameiurus melas]